MPFKFKAILTRQVADDRHQILTALYLHLEDGKAVLRVVVGDPFNESVQGFGHGQEVVTPFAVEFTPLLFPLRSKPLSQLL